ncbi:asparagine synthase (glutamine-hydrolyzing) [uncultured Desulfosarcina sp.]|uniref:asparagine synthase (glutamine-hydrolyzing) n=1 Tax=uncultured Desulfosarcina sp. TaxID=218289 RepID=UPI0029C96FA9|nr:asparagine synthase (glutamine-hydrolyzing) [uncultured Desulfosarcina sp.]
MCGIAGFTRTACPTGDKQMLYTMGLRIAHRGPDAHGEYLDDHIGLAHRRLSIIDLSADGTQPMVSSCGRYQIVFNGEIYNFQQLRQRFADDGVQFRTRTDTEVILASYARHGKQCLHQLHGMYAFALWDMQEKTLFLARDRIGKKPLYWWWGGNDRLAFASELKCLFELPDFQPEIEPTAVVDYLKYLYIPAPKSIYQNVYKLLPGHSLTLRIGAEPRIEKYWDVDFSVQDSLGFEDATRQLLQMIEEKTRLRMVADVPLGAFLSGGVDSSGIVALMAKHSTDPVRTCTIGFNNRRYDESEFAREVAKRFSTHHSEYRVQDNLTNTIELLPRYFDEPFADSSALPTYHVSRLARQAVTVALAGDGGDESFGGYQKYVTELVEDRVRRSVPGFVLKPINWVCASAEQGACKKAASLTAAALTDAANGYYMTNSFITDSQLSQLLSEPISAACHGYDPAELTKSYWARFPEADHVTRMLYTDIKTYLPGDILVKVDRTSMAHALEVRAPLLDHEIVEYAASLPSRWKILGRQKKIILRKAFATLLPETFLARRKQGFTVPLASWFRKELKPLFVSEVLDNPELCEFFCVENLKKFWEVHQAGRGDHGQLLWTILSFAIWHKEYFSSSARGR